MTVTFSVPVGTGKLTASTLAGNPVVVTGANGFLGSALCQILAARGYEHKKVVRRAYPGAISVGNIDDQTVWVMHYLV